MINKNLLIITLVIASTVVVSIFLRSSNNRYYMVSNKDGYVYQLDKKSGNSWLLAKNRKIPVEDIASLKNKEESNIKIKSTATKDKAFLNTTWKMSPREIEKVNKQKLTEIEDYNEYGIDFVDTRRFKLYESSVIKLWDAEARVDYTFFDNKLFKYVILIEDEFVDQS